MAGDPDPIDDVVVDDEAVAKGDFRGYVRTRTSLILASADELRSLDLTGRLLVTVLATSRTYQVDTEDTTTADDGETYIRDANGLLFVAIAGGGASAAPSYREHTEAGDVTVDASDRIIGVNKATGAATGVPMPAAADRAGLPLMIKDIKRDADTNNITITFDGAETCDGLTEIVITTPGGWIDMGVREGGYFIMGAQL